MASNIDTIRDLAQQDYKWGFITESDDERAPRGLNEDIIRLISAKKREPEFMLQWRLKAFRRWVSLEKGQAEPKWANIHYGPIDYQNIIYYSAPKQKPGLKSLDEVDPGDPAHIRKAGHSSRTSRSVWPAWPSMPCSTAFPWPRRSRRSLPNWASSSARFPKPLRNIPSWSKSISARWCRTPTTISRRSTRRSSPTAPLSTSPRACAARWSCRTYFRINAAETGQFERTLIVADEGAYVSYLEGCTAPDARRESVACRRGGAGGAG